MNKTLFTSEVEDDGITFVFEFVQDDRFRHVKLNFYIYVSTNLFFVYKEYIDFFPYEFKFKNLSSATLRSLYCKFEAILDNQLYIRNIHHKDAERIFRKVYKELYPKLEEIYLMDE